MKRENSTDSKLAQPVANEYLGSHWDGTSTHFSVFSSAADGAELCLFERMPDGSCIEAARLELSESEKGVFSRTVDRVGPGQLYGYRIHGRYEPAAGLRINPNKVLLDPYARAIGRPFAWSDSIYDFDLGQGFDPAEPKRSALDSAPAAPLGMVVDERFDWQGDSPPRIPWDKTLIYEAHVRGATIRHPLVNQSLRGKFLGLSAPAMIDHFNRLGVTAIELLPVTARIDELRLARNGLTNFWGYNPLSFFALDPRFGIEGGSAADIISEFKSFVRAMHQAGIEVILDLVFNHTGEGGRDGPSVSFRGLDNLAYYRSDLANPALYWDVTGCGNSVRTSHPAVTRLILDSLRYWVVQMHVDGFRFDLGAALARGDDGRIDMQTPLIKAICSDPILAQAKIIFEPWDLGPDGYQIGAFPPPIHEWNGRFRDTVRRFWRGLPGNVPELATRISGSSDQYCWNGRTPQAGINFITSHDGFTLRDLTEYSRKHNLSNRELNRDGANDDDSFNLGEEGPTDLNEIRTVRTRQQMNLAATLLLSTGVPMILAGDEFLRTQYGNNNCYCQDNQLSWINWNFTDEQVRFYEFFTRLTALRRTLPFVRRSQFFKGQLEHSGLKDVLWFNPDGTEFSDFDWQSTSGKLLGVMFSNASSAISRSAAAGSQIRRERNDDNCGIAVIYLLNSETREVNFRYPAALGPVLKKGGRLRVIFDTARGGFVDSLLVLNQIEGYQLAPISSAALIVEN